MNKKIKIESSKLDLSRLGYGCARLDINDYSQSLKLIEQCLEFDITHFDTAPSYGTETLLGGIIGNTKNITVASKIGIKRKNHEKNTESLLRKIYKRSIKPFISLPPSVKHKIINIKNTQTNYLKIEKRKLHKDEILVELEQSLKNLKRNELDILLIHEPDQFFLDDELEDIFINLQKSGYIKEYGLGYGAHKLGQTFGKIIQLKYEGNNLDRDFLKKTDESIRIYHGVIRDNFMHINNTTIKETVKRVLSRNDNTILFSASKIDQIKEIKSFLN